MLDKNKIGEISEKISKIVQQIVEDELEKANKKDKFNIFNYVDKIPFNKLTIDDVSDIEFKNIRRSIFEDCNDKKYEVFAYINYIGHVITVNDIDNYTIKELKEMILKDYKEFWGKKSDILIPRF